MCNILSRHKGELFIQSTQPFIFILPPALVTWPLCGSRKVWKLSRPNVIVSCENLNISLNTVTVLMLLKSYILHLKHQTLTKQRHRVIALTFKSILKKNNAKLSPEEVTLTTGRRHDCLPEDVCMPTTAGPQHKTQSPWSAKISDSCFCRYHQNNASTTDRPFSSFADPHDVILQSTGSKLGQTSSQNTILIHINK